MSHGAVCFLIFSGVGGGLPTVRDEYCAYDLSELQTMAWLANNRKPVAGSSAWTRQQAWAYLRQRRGLTTTQLEALNQQAVALRSIQAPTTGPQVHDSVRKAWSQLRLGTAVLSRVTTTDLNTHLCLLRVIDRNGYRNRTIVCRPALSRSACEQHNQRGQWQPQLYSIDSIAFALRTDGKLHGSVTTNPLSSDTSLPQGVKSWVLQHEVILVPWFAGNEVVLQTLAMYMDSCID